ADLVGAPAVGDDAEDRVARGDRQAAVAGAGRVGAPALAEGAGDGALGRRDALGRREVNEAPRRRQRVGPHGRGALVLGEHAEAAGAGVEAMNRLELAVYRGREARAAVEQRATVLPLVLE